MTLAPPFVSSSGENSIHSRSSQRPDHDGPKEQLMQISLDDEEKNELTLVLDDVLRDMSHEIADTDNPSFREHLRDRRTRLLRVRSALD
jgi:hypothetical protein